MAEVISALYLLAVRRENPSKIIIRGVILLRQLLYTTVLRD